MARFYFSESSNPDELGPHDEGLDFDTVEAAIVAGEQALREMAADETAATIWMSVFDENRKLIHRTRLEVSHVVGGGQAAPA